MKYSNTDCLDSVGKYCATFDGGNQYVLLSNQSISDVTKVSFTVKINAIYSDASKLYSIFAGFNLRCNFGIRKDTAAHFCLWVGNGEHTGIFEITNLNVTVGSIYNVEVSFDYNSGYSCIVNGNSYTLSFINSNTPTALNVYTLLGASRNTSNANYQPSYCNLWDFKCYDANDNLIHWYPLTEGEGTIANDVVGTVNGSIITTDINTFWSNTQDIFTYTVGDRFTPVSFKGKISNNNCATFSSVSGSTYTNIGYINFPGLSNVVKFSCWFKLPNLTSGGHIFDSVDGTHKWFVSFYNDNGTYKLSLRDTAVATGGANDWMTFKLATIMSANEWVYFEFDSTTITYDGVHAKKFKLNGVEYIAKKESSANVYDWSQLVYPKIGGTNFVGSVCDFKCYDANDNLIHWYPLSEGANAIAYDAIGDINGTISSTSISTFWGSKQNVFVYDAVYGYKQDINKLDTTKIPLNSNGYLFDLSMIPTASYAGKTFVEYSKPSDVTTSFSNGIMTCITNASSTGTDNITVNLNRTIKAGTKVYIDLTTTTDGARGWTTLGFDQTKWGSSAGYVNASALEYDIQSGIYEITLTADATYLRITKNNPDTITTLTATFKIYTDTANYEPITNGIPPCESQLDFTQGIANIAELKNVSPANVYPKTWYKSNFSSSIDGWSEQGVLTYISYSDNKLFFTIPAGDTARSAARFNHSVLNGFALSDKFNTGTWHFKGIITNNSASAFSGSETLSISIGSYYGAWGVASFSTNFSEHPLSIGESLTLDLDIPNKSSVQYFNNSILIQLYFSNGIMSDTTIERKIALSNVEITYIPASNTYAPTYFDVLPDNSIQNPVVYKEAQTDADLARVINHVKNN